MHSYSKRVKTKVQEGKKTSTGSDEEAEDGIGERLASDDSNCGGSSGLARVRAARIRYPQEAIRG